MRPPPAGASLFAGRTLLRRMARVCRCLFGFVLPGAWPVGPACRLVRGQGRQNGIRLSGAAPVTATLPAATGPAPAAAGRRRHVLQDVEALAKALIVYDLALAQEEQRLDDLLVVRHVHQVFVGRARLLFWYDCVRTNNAGNPHKHCIFVSTSLFRLRLYKNNL